MSESRIQARGLFSNLPTGSRNIVTDEVVNLTPPFGVIQIELANGDNTITAPVNTKAVLINFDPTSTTLKSLKARVADIGMVIGTIGWIFFPLVIASTPAFIINSVGADTGRQTEVVFF